MTEFLVSAYVNFVHDFPRRCRDILEAFETQAAARNREVTLLLAVASAGLVVPYERVAAHGAHPSGDRENFPATAAGLSQALLTRLADTSLAGELGAWRFGQVGSLKGKPDHWDGFSKAKPSGNKKAGTVLRTIRNALAHGNIWTREDPIRELVFAREVRDGTPEGNLLHYEYVRGSPDAFRMLLIAWFDLLDALETDPATASGALDLAA
jgi:hypothetical protein